MSAIEHEISIQFRKNNKHNHVISFNQSVYTAKDGESINIGSMIASDAEKDIEQQNNIVAVKQLLTCLTEKERQIISLRYGLDGDSERALEEVGHILGCTKQAVHQHEQKALKKMKKIFITRI